MTIDSVTQMWSRSSGDTASPDGLKFTKGYRAAYQVVHSADETMPAIETATGLPQLGDLYPGTSGVFCTKVGPVERVGPIFSIVPIEYTGETADNDPTSDPINKAPEITYQSREVVEEIDQDINGLPITNTNGEVVEGLQDSIWDYALSVKRNFVSISPYILRLYARSYSSDSFFGGWPAGTASMKSFSAKPVFIGGFINHWEVSAVILFREPYNTIPAHAWWKRYRNEGLYVRAGTTVTFSGGGGSGAAAYAVVSSGGAVTSIPVTNRGSGYTTAPTVTITSSTGGTGATATATINSNGLVTGVSVGAGGTGYKSKLIRAVDSNGEAVSKPVLLAADGTQELNADNAIWLERPTKQALPYGALGLV
jgi:hypothetical protein